MAGHNFAGTTCGSRHGRPDRRLGEENTRAALFEPCQRKETFAVQASRIQGAPVRRVGVHPGHARRQGLVKTGYAKGVPMGGDLPQRGPRPRPSWCGREDLRPAISIASQIVKGWTRAARASRRSRRGLASDRKPAKATGMVRRSAARWTSRCTYTNTIGAVELKTV